MKSLFSNLFWIFLLGSCVMGYWDDDTKVEVTTTVNKAQNEVTEVLEDNPEIAETIEAVVNEGASVIKEATKIVGSMVGLEFTEKEPEKKEPASEPVKEDVVETVEVVATPIEETPVVMAEAPPQPVEDYTPPTDMKILTPQL